jgi:hypothetical protein
MRRRHGSVFKRAFCQQDATCVGARATDCPGDLRQALRQGAEERLQHAEAIAEAALRPNLRFVQEKNQDQLDWTGPDNTLDNTSRLRAPLLWVAGTADRS